MNDIYSWMNNAAQEILDNTTQGYTHIDDFFKACVLDLTSQPDGTFNVHFEINYEQNFVGGGGSWIEGYDDAQMYFRFQLQNACFQSGSSPAGTYDFNSLGTATYYAMRQSANPNIELTDVDFIVSADGQTVTMQNATINTSTSNVGTAEFSSSSTVTLDKCQV